MTVLTTGEDLALRFRAVRRRSEELCKPLAIEDYVPQPVTEVSPPKWHLGHTAWFFEAMVLQRFVPGYSIFHPRFAYVFNSYYEGAGGRVARDQRGALSRPTVAEVLAYRSHIDAAICRLLAQPLEPAALALIELGLQHEQQHQELLLTDIKWILGANPLRPAYDPQGLGAISPDAEHEASASAQADWLDLPSGIYEVGYAGAGFAFDNEWPRHSVLLPATQLRTSLVSNAEYLAFMRDGAYERHEFWHAEAWDWLRSLPHPAPLYWQPDEAQPGEWLHYSLVGMQPLPDHAPVSHLSFYEAFAFCQWAGYRLPTEFEWEAAAARLPWGQRWEWTQSAYQPYPGFQRSPELVGEYNGKFMVNQQVLRGASFATPPGHARPSYRNFFHPHLRWQYTGLRLARAGA